MVPTTGDHILRRAATKEEAIQWAKENGRTSPACAILPTSAFRITGAPPDRPYGSGGRDQLPIARMPEFTILERAFALAKTGRYTMTERREAQAAEGYDAKQLQGPSLQKQLRQLCEDSRKRPKT